MDRYAVFGNPVSHSLSPEIHARFAAAMGERFEYGRELVALGEFEAHARRFFDSGAHGANVTLPFKIDAFRFASRIAPRARTAGAANFLARESDGILADNTDGTGLVVDLTRNLGLALAARRILVLGAGGAVRGVMGPLLEARPAGVTIANRTLATAVELAGAFASLGKVDACALDRIPEGDYAVVINATSTSVHGTALELPAHVLRRGTFAYDMAYGSKAREFVERARAAGAAASDGLGMLVEQAAESYLLWRGHRPPTDAVLAELRARLA